VRKRETIHRRIVEGESYLENRQVRGERTPRVVIDLHSYTFFPPPLFFTWSHVAVKIALRKSRVHARGTNHAVMLHMQQPLRRSQTRRRDNNSKKARCTLTASQRNHVVS
jgi:hypothetical protein